MSSFSFTLINPDAPTDTSQHILYVAGSGDAYENKLKLTLTYTGSRNFKLKSDDYIAIDLGAIFNTQEVGAIQLSSVSGIASTSQWSIKGYPQHPKYLKLVYSGSDVTWSPNAKLVIDLDKIRLASTYDGPQPINVTTKWTRSPPSPNGGQVDFTSENPPVPSKNDLQIQITSPSDRKVYAGSQNTLVLTLTNTAAEALQRGTDTKINLWFDVGEGDGEIASADAVSTFELNVTNNYGNDWNAPHATPTKSARQGHSNYIWTFQSAAEQVMGKAGAQGHMELTFTNLVPNNEPGVANLYIQFSGLKNYNDKTYVVTITKELAFTACETEPGPYVGPMYQGRAAVDISNGPVDVTLKWTLNPAAGVTALWFDDKSYRLETRSATVTIDEEKAYDLLAYHEQTIIGVYQVIGIKFRSGIDLSGLDLSTLNLDFSVFPAGPGLFNVDASKSIFRGVIAPSFYTGSRLDEAKVKANPSARPFMQDCQGALFMWQCSAVGLSLGEPIYLYARASDLSGADLCGARHWIIRDSIAKKADLRDSKAHAKFGDNQPAGVNYLIGRGCDFSGAKLQGADLRGAWGLTLSNTSLTGATYDDNTLWPEPPNGARVDPEKRGAIKMDD